MELIPRRSRSVSLFPTDMDRLFEQFLTPWENTSFEGWSPSLDVKETEKELMVKAEVPGIDPKEIDISVTGNRLTIRGEKKDEHEETKGNVFRTERRFGSFQRVIELPQNVDAGKIAADYSNGVLTVRIPKAESAQPRKIEVKAAQ